MLQIKTTLKPPKKLVLTWVCRWKQKKNELILKKRKLKKFKTFYFLKLVKHNKNYINLVLLLNKDNKSCILYP